MAVSGDNLKSGPVTDLDATPIVMPTAGEGGAAALKVRSDWLATTASAAITSAYRLLRLPSNAKLKKLELYSINLGSTAGATLDINVAFSDATTDGTPVAGQGLIPTTALDGTTTTAAAYSSANKMFGSALATGATNAASGPTDITFSGTFTPAMRELPLWAVLGGSGAATAAPFAAGGGFAQAGGQICDPGGFFDFYIVIAATGTGTVTAGKIALQAEYVS